MNNKIILTFNSHRTYNNALTSTFIELIKLNRQIEYLDKEFLAYSINDLKIVIDSIFSVYISIENPVFPIEDYLSLAKNEYKFLTTLNKRFDPKSAIDVTVSKDLIHHINECQYVDTDDAFFCCIN